MNEGISTVGRHVLVELYGCDPAATDDPAVVRDSLVGAAHAMGATPLAEAFHRFSPQGVSGVVLIAESHLSCHTWPEAGYVAVDIYTCGAIHPRAAIEHLTAAFRARTHLVQDVVRGLVDLAPERPVYTTTALLDRRASHTPMRRVCDRIDTGTRRHVFAAHGVVDVTGVVSAETTAAVREEARRVLDRFAGPREDAPGETRSLALVGGELVGEHCRLVRQLYTSRDLLDPLEEIAGAALHPCAAPGEQLLVTRQRGRADIGAWRRGAHGHALVWILEAPPVASGGLLQCVPRAGWDEADPRALEHLTAHPIQSYYFRAGSLYLINADAMLHRTEPLGGDGARVLLTMSWDQAGDPPAPCP